MSTRELAIEYFIKALSTGERSAAERLAPHLAEQVEYDTNSQPGVLPIGREHFRGKAEVLARVSGDWPATPQYGRLGWSEPAPVDGHLEVTSSGTVTLSFQFNADDQIREVRLDGGWGSGVVASPPVGGAVDEITLGLRGLINHARANQTPMTVTYVGTDDAPHSSFRGSVCVVGPTELAIWVRDANGGLPNAVAVHPHVSLVYSDFRAGATINIAGTARVANDPETRRKVYERGPEVEQTHDLERRGVAVVVRVDKLQAFVAGVPYSIG